METSRTTVGSSATNTSGVALSPQQQGNAPEIQEAVSCAEPVKAKKRTVGNLIYDVGVFGSTAWFGVSLMSALVAHEAMHGNNASFGWLRSLNDKVANGAAKAFTKILPKTTSKETIDGLAKGTSMFATLGTGGSLLMAPLKWMEDNRQKNAARIDHALGTTPPDPETIAQEPKQTWKSVMSGRLLSWGTSYGAFLAMGPKLTGTISNWFGEKASEGFMKMKPNANPATVRRWADIAAFDALFTVITAGITYLYSRHVAKEDDKGTTQREAHPTPSALPQDSEKDDVKSTRFTDTIKTSNRQITVPQGAFAGRLGSEAETSAGHAI